MKKLMSACLLVILASTSCALYAEEKSASFWDTMRKKVETIAPKKQLGATTAVGGVRGAPSDVNDFYWKGEVASAQVDAQELSDFNKAFELGAAGNAAQAQIAFQWFIKSYPDSILRKDADQALVVLSGK
jgi:hypothetical protein